MDNLATEIERFDPSLPIERASTPPAFWYTDSAFYELETQSALANNWLIAARRDQLVSKGSFVCGEVAGERYVVVRDDNDVLRGFYNVCRHHAAAVAQGAGVAKRFSCPYHGWTYGLDGRLLNAPETGNLENFDPKCHGLKPIAVEAWGPFVFVSLNDPARPLASDLGELGRSLDGTRYESLRFATRREYTMACNWKVYVDNYLDGGYHVSYLHKGLASQLDLTSYQTKIFDRFSIQSGAGSAAKQDKQSEPHATEDFAERVGDHVLYAWVYPNFMINRYGPIMDTNWVIPVSAGETRVIFDYYFLDTDGEKAAEFIERSIAASDIVQQEDSDICEAVQHGLKSRSYDTGRYSAEREMGEYHFHRLLHADLAKAIG